MSRPINLNPASGTISFSILILVPTKRTSIFFNLRPSATAKAG